MARNRRLEQLRTYSGLQIPKTVVTNYLSGRWKMDTLIKSIKKFNATETFANETWEGEFRDLERNYPGRTKQEVFEEILHHTRRASFFGDDTVRSYGAALNDALQQIDPNNEELKKLESLGKHIDFTQWSYNENNQMMEYSDGVYLYQVSFMENRLDHDYTDGALVVNKTPVKKVI